MTLLEAHARAIMEKDSGPEDLSWEDSPDDERRTYLLRATEERAYAHALALVIAEGQHGSGFDDEDVDWYRDLVLDAISQVGPPTYI